MIYLRFLFTIILFIVTNEIVGQLDCVSEEYRVSCFPDSFGTADIGIQQELCLRRGCGWCNVTEESKSPPCFLPLHYGYKMIGSPIETSNGITVVLEKSDSISLFSKNSQRLSFTAYYDSNYRLRIKIEDGTPRYEVPIEIQPASGGNANRLYKLDFSNDPVFSFKIIRIDSGIVIFDTSLGGFTFSDQFLQISSILPTENLYGIGENEQTTFKHHFEGYPTYPLFTRGQPPERHFNIYGVHPYYTLLENDGNSHSVAFINSNAQEFVLIPRPGFIYRTIGGIFDIYFFFGPTPENTVQQYTEAVGRHQIPPYWALGFQLCKYGYDSLENMKAAVNRTEFYKIPHDVQYGDIDIMDRALDFTINKKAFAGLPQYVKDLKTKGIKFVTILDPFISTGEPKGTYKPFDLGEEMDIWVKNKDGKPFVGRVWPVDPIYFPDYSKNSTRSWWILLIKEFKDLIDYDGLWIDMNEPANFWDGEIDGGCEMNKWNSPPYTPKVRNSVLYNKTICMDAVSQFGKHYDSHSLYGWSESEPTYAAVRGATGKRGLVLSRSTFLGSGKWTSHWLGDNFSQWSNLGLSIIGMLQFNHFGIPFVGADICGFFNETTPEMCQRWQQLGAFYTFSRNHNMLGMKDQDPGFFGETIAESSRRALITRYTLLPYLYTLFYKHYTEGNTVIRALWHQFPKDPNTHSIDRQFLWGSGFLVSPVLEEGALTVSAYFPNTRVFNYYNGMEVGTRGGFETLPAPMNEINLHILGGNILPTQDPLTATNTQIARKNPLGLIVALDEDGKAEGEMYFDDGDSQDPVENGAYLHVTYKLENGILEGIVIHDGDFDPQLNLRYSSVRILGSGVVSSVKINGAEISFSQDPLTKEVKAEGFILPASNNFTLTFS